MWKVSDLENVSGSVWVQATDGFISMQGPCDANQFVDPPNLIERILGITFENKIKKAIKRCQKWCDKKNKKAKESEKVIQKIGQIL